jgi:hypothetical protein
MFEKIPAEILREIFQYLSAEDTSRISRVNKKWYSQSSHDDLWQTHLAEIAGDHFEKDPTDLRSYKEIYVTTIKNLPACAKQFIEIIHYSENKLVEEYDENSFSYLEETLNNINTIPDMLNIYSVIKYLVQLKHNFKEDAQVPNNILFGYSFYSIEHILAALNEPEALQLIIAHGGNVNVTGPSKHTPLHIAATFNSYDSALVLKNLGASLEKRCDANSNSMERAAFQFNYQLLELLYIDTKTDLETWDRVTFFEHLLNTLKEDDPFQKFTDEPVDIEELYQTKHSVLKNTQDEAEYNNELQKNLHKEDYKILKTLDFFIEKAWPLPNWFSKIINLEPPTKRARLALE